MSVFLIMYLNIAFFLQLFSFTSGPEIYINEFIRSAALGQFFNFQCMRSGYKFPNFMFFSRKHHVKHQILVPDDIEILKLSDFDPGRPTKIIIHGFMDSFHMSDWMQRMTAKILEMTHCNVIIVDWSCGNLFPYARALQNSKIVSKKLVELIQFLKDERQAEPSTFHLIGHSMGSHIAARVGHAIPNLGRITALDPAFPRFYRMPLEERLDASDAKFVDVIHSNAGYSIFEGIGIKTRVGHLDFYPNGGNNQPGCKQPPSQIFPRLGFLNGTRYYLSCDHFRAVEYFIESIHPVVQSNSSSDIQCYPLAVACKDWKMFSEGRCADCSFGGCAVMGYHSDLFPNNGIRNREYFLQTFDEAPFCTFQYQVTIETESFQNATNGEIRRGRSIINRGVIRLELEAKDGRITRLDDKDTKEIKPNDFYMYLATSRVHIDAIQRANFWFDSLMSTNVPVFGGPHSMNLKRIKIMPIELQILPAAPFYSAEYSREIVMCGLNDKTIEGNKIINLIVSDC